MGWAEADHGFTHILVTFYEQYILPLEGAISQHTDQKPCCTKGVMMVTWEDRPGVFYSEEHSGL